MKEVFLPYHDRIADLAKEIAEHRSQGIVVLDASSLEEIEDEYGGDAYGEVRQRLLAILEEQRGKDYRNEDILTLDKPRGLRFVVFLDRKMGGIFIFLGVLDARFDARGLFEKYLRKLPA